MLKSIWCSHFHRPYRRWYGSGDWSFHHCSKCEITWPEPRTGMERGVRVESYADLRLPPTPEQIK